MEFQLGWMSYLTTTNDVIYASIDGRGSGARGDDFLYAVYQKLGTVEVQDQLKAIEWVHLNHLTKSHLLNILNFGMLYDCQNCIEIPYLNTREKIFWHKLHKYLLCYEIWPHL